MGIGFGLLDACIIGGVCCLGGVCIVFPLTCARSIFAYCLRRLWVLYFLSGLMSVDWIAMLGDVIVGTCRKYSYPIANHN
jgi:hypothetical protein